MERCRGRFSSVWSLPARGVWIEIKSCAVKVKMMPQSLPARGVWIEIGLSAAVDGYKMSLPARGVWIEISTVCPELTRSWSLPARGVWIEILR